MTDVFVSYIMMNDNPGSIKKDRSFIEHIDPLPVGVFSSLDNAKKMIECIVPTGWHDEKDGYTEAMLDCPTKDKAGEMYILWAGIIRDKLDDPQGNIFPPVLWLIRNVYWYQLEQGIVSEVI